MAATQVARQLQRSDQREFLRTGGTDVLMGLAVLAYDRTNPFRRVRGSHDEPNPRCPIRPVV